MSELQPGMLAIGLGFIMSTHRNGQSCTAIEIVIPFDGIIDHESGDWRVQWSDGIISRANKKNLLPIPPLSDPLDVTHKEELHA